MLSISVFRRFAWRKQVVLFEISLSPLSIESDLEEHENDNLYVKGLNN